MTDKLSKLYSECHTISDSSRLASRWEVKPAANVLATGAAPGNMCSN